MFTVQNCNESWGEMVSKITDLVQNHTQSVIKYIYFHFNRRKAS